MLSDLSELVEGTFVKCGLLRSGRKVIQLHVEVAELTKGSLRKQDHESVCRAHGCSDCGNPSVLSQNC